MGIAGAPGGVILADLVGADGGFGLLGVEFLLEGWVAAGACTGHRVGLGRGLGCTIYVAGGAVVGVPDEGLEEGCGDGAARRGKHD